MAHLCSLLLIAILTVVSGATPLYCSDVQSPASGSGHNTDLSQVTTLQYCIIDNCTIMRIDTGQQLDIVYTIESLIIVIPKGGHTSWVITKIEDELPCLENYNITIDSRNTVYEAINVLLMMIVSVCIIIVYLLFKDLRTSLFGKLLMFYNLALVIAGSTFLSLLLMHYWITVNSQAICHTATVIFILSFPCVESFATNILCYSAYLMYRCYHLKPDISKKRSKYLFKSYLAYSAFTLVLLFFIIIAYDWRTGNGKYTIMENGHCYVVDHSSYNTLVISTCVAGINKFIQIMMFMAYLVYFYKFNMNVRAEQITLQYNKNLFRIPIAMGSTVGLSFFIFALVLFISEYSNITHFITSALFVIQQAVIFACLVCTKKMLTMCKACFQENN